MTRVRVRTQPQRVLALDDAQLRSRAGAKVSLEVASPSGVETFEYESGSLKRYHRATHAKAPRESLEAA
jgi:hypothetical protein